ncbi:MAG TPA: HNH endonuclease [Acidocella sp.]|nr:HNH endonuclease [Acidocella sp.]
MADTPKPTFELNRLTEYSDDAVLEELRRVSALVPEGVFTESIFEKHALVGRNTVRRRFGSWFKALERAGLSGRSSDEIKTRGATPSVRMSDQDILADLRRLAELLGTDQLTNRDINNSENKLRFSSTTLRKRWGSLKGALESAGLKTSALGRRYSDGECYDNLLKVWTHYGRPPMYKEMSHPPSVVGGKAYMSRFGGWNKALSAFVAKVNSETDLLPECRDNDVLQPEKPKEIIAEDRRDIALGLRFRVLNRDKFKCVLCGDHPARNPECVLHVDHILPWSRGGKTREDNLRTLCSVCNIGRGNRFTD